MAQPETNLPATPPSTDPTFIEPESPLPPFLNSITELRSLSSALSAFYRCFDDLQSHFASIDSAIDSKLSPILDDKKEPVAPVPAQVIEKEKVKENSVRQNSSELESLCAMMSSKLLRKYMVSNLSDSVRLREEVPKALKLAPNPAKLVFECSGRFFLQGIKAYTTNSPMIPAREASILALECFLLMENESGGTKIEKAIRNEAEEAAKGWRKRLISEGGLAKACEIDARGLLMFVACFGVPSVFRFEDFRDLAKAGNVKDILGVLKRSSLLMEKITDIIEGLVESKMGVDAVDMAYTFGVQDKITPQTTLASYLQDSKEAWKRAKRESQSSPTSTNEAKKKHLATLTSVVKCAESHGIDAAKLLPGWPIHEKISNLEKDIAEFQKQNVEKALQKRKANEIDSSKKLRNVELKRSRHTIHGLPQQKLSAHADGQRNLLDHIPGHASSSFASPSLLHGTGVGLLAENISSSALGIGVRVRGAGIAGSALTGASGLLQTGPYAGSHAEAIVDSGGHVISYGSQSYMHADMAYEERLASYAGQPSSIGLTSLYRPSASIEGFAGLPSNSTVGVPSRSSVSDLYQFADAVVESDPYHSRASRQGGAVRHVLPGHHHSSYFH